MSRTAGTVRAFLSRCALPAVLAGALYAQAPPIQAPVHTLEGFDQYVLKTMTDWNVPGAAIAVVKDDRIVMAKGYGTRTIRRTEPVDERTLFAIGSATKAFTATAIGMLVDGGKVGWNDPATKHLAGFQLYDPYVTRELTVRDLLSHRSGLSRGDLLFYGSTFSRDEILRRLRYLKPTSSFRSEWGYQNILYLAAGQIVPPATGMTWDAFVKTRIFAPLNMTSSLTTARGLANVPNVATPHSRLEDGVGQISWREIDNIAPAGSIISNVVDLAQWVRVHLREGLYGSDRLFSAGVAKEMHTPQTVIRQEPPFTQLFPEAHFVAYGLGWFLHDYRGRKVVSHGGSTDGMKASVAFMPEEQLGVVILMNLDGVGLPEPLMFRVFDMYLGGAQRDWSSEARKRGAAARASQESSHREQPRVLGTKPTRPLNDYTGAYRNEMYGDVKVTLENEHLVLNFGATYTGILQHWNYDSFKVRWNDPFIRAEEEAYTIFRLGLGGTVDELRLTLRGITDYAFIKIP